MANRKQISQILCLPFSSAFFYTTHVKLKVHGPNLVTALFIRPTMGS